jgi:N-acetyl-gamma-glutamyl-phosphate reductase|tara:strand:+ start:10461 stop:11501 length:1041 start_codon:yes stop_codon:yes gene_type:complete
MNSKIKVSVVGGSGYTGVELLRLLIGHPNVIIHEITSRNDAGKLVSEIYPSLRGCLPHYFVDPDKADLKKADLVFFATPNGIAMNYVTDLLENGVKVIDLAADFRIQDVAIWEKWYEMKHSAVKELKSAVYGLPELNREAIKQAQLVANPGCYPTAIQLALIPLIKSNLINTETIIADAKSGISGAGKKTETQFLMSEASENFKAYSLKGHRHLPEIEENLKSISSNNKIKLTFVPHLLPMVRGIHATLYVDCIKDFDPSVIFNDFYKDELFVDVMESGSCPETKSVRGSNVCRLSFYKIPETNRLVILSVIDNLVKGAAGQALQNMNIMMGWPESAGLDLIPLHP